MAGWDRGTGQPDAHERILAPGQALRGAPSEQEGREAEAILLAWRKSAFQWLMWAILVTGGIRLLMVFLVHPDIVPLGSLLVVLSMYLVLVGVTLVRSVAHEIRAWVMVAAGYGVAVMMLASNGLAGGGRTVLFVLPLYAMVLVGRRSGWVAAALSVAVFGAAALGASANGGGSLSMRFWLLQGTMLALTLGAVMLLVSSLLSTMKRAFEAQHEGGWRIAQADRERRRLEMVLLETGERERRAVGHQLHDGPCQQITAALLRCKVAQKSLAVRGADEEIGHIQAVAEMLDASVGEIHDLARGLSPPEIAPGALVAALADLAQRVRTAGPATCEFSHTGSVPKSAVGTSSQLFRIAQEAVSNSVRHSRAGHIQIELAGGPEALQLRVRDDGLGVAPDADRGGMGLRIMKHRAELMGGSLHIDPAGLGGTVVTCTLPLPLGTVARESLR